MLVLNSIIWLKNESNWAISQNSTTCMMLSIIHASYLDDYKIALSFNIPDFWLKDCY
jgi:hypothetical protein